MIPMNTNDDIKNNIRLCIKGHNNIKESEMIKIYYSIMKDII